MHKLIVLFSFFMISISTSFASEERCKRILTDDHSVTSKVFQLDLDQNPIKNYRTDYVAEAIALVRVLLTDLSCTRADVNFGKGALGRSKNRCKQLAENRPYTRVCVIETNLGLFTVKKDFQNTANFIYQNWD